MRRCIAVLILALAIGSVGVCFAGEKLSSQSDTIKKAQEGLATLEMYKGEADGKMNLETREAIKEFRKKEMGMEMPSGMLDKKTCDMITEKADEKKLTNDESATSIMDKAQDKIDKGKEKIPAMPDMPK